MVSLSISPSSGITPHGYVARSVWLAVYAVTLAATVVLFGGAFPLAQAVLPAFCALLMLLTPSSGRPAPRMVLAGIFLPVAVCLAWAACQLVPMNSGNQYWRLVQGGAGTTSLGPWQTLNHVVLALGYLGFAWSVYQAGRVMPVRILVVTALTLAAACAYGLTMAATGTESVLWLPKTAYIGYLTGTFINKNSFATLAALGVLASLTMVLLRVGEISSRLTTRQRFKAFWLLVIVPGWPWLLITGVCFMALVLTGSRAGLAAGACGVVLLLGSLAVVRRAARAPLTLTMGLMVMVFMIVLGAVGQGVGKRLTHLQNDGQTRDAIYSLTHRLIAENPLTGTGFGTFQQAFSTVRDAELLRKLPSTVEYAHNTYLELTTELGLPGILLLAVATMSLLAVLLNGIGTRRRAIIWPALGLASCLVVGGHALADFSLSVPAVTLVALSFAMLGVAQAIPGKESTEPQAASRWQHASRVAALPLLALALWLSWAEYHAFQAEPAVRAMQSGQQLRPSDIFPAQKQLQQCLALRPAHAGCQEGLAQSYLSLATAYGLTGPQRGVALVYLNLAQIHYSQALSMSPANPWAWYRLSRVQAYLGDTAAANASLANSLLTGPYEPKLAILRIPFIFSLMSQASPEDAALYGINAAAVWQTHPRKTENEVRQNPTVWPLFAAMLQAQQAPLPRWLKY